MAKNYILVEPRKRAEWRQWLLRHYKQTESIWLVLHKKGSEGSTLTLSEAVEEALCFGWIDSVSNKLDEHRYKILVSPRKPKSNWSKINKTRAQNMIRAGLMHPSGQAMITLAKKTGTWTALNKIDKMIVPPDLAAALAKNKKAKAFFEAFPPSTRKGILEWIQNAKTSATRSRRIAETVSLAAVNVRANQYPRKAK
ncbi:MAG: YdeI/OmpD-associated family protein [Cyclobacteriaceae bacterium]|jgi:uncharacterized protein YdeI (YjbR/CyaY-like superfamily)